MSLSKLCRLLLFQSLSQQLLSYFPVISQSFVTILALVDGSVARILYIVESEVHVDGGIS